MAGLSLLKSLKANRHENDPGGLEYEWGSSKVLQSKELSELSRDQLRNHLQARDLDDAGSKRAMIDRLQASLEEERLQSIAYTEALEAEFQINKDLEERGAVYAVGANYCGASSSVVCRLPSGIGRRHSSPPPPPGRDPCLSESRDVARRRRATPGAACGGWRHHRRSGEDRRAASARRRGAQKKPPPPPPRMGFTPPRPTHTSHTALLQASWVRATTSRGA